MSPINSFYICSDTGFYRFYAGPLRIFPGVQIVGELFGSAAKYFLHIKQVSDNYTSWIQRYTLIILMVVCAVFRPWSSG